jgi:CRISPR-associated protein Csx3
MTKPIISVTDISHHFRKAAFEIPNGICTPAEFAEAVGEIAAKLPGDKPLLINGRGPVWGYGMLIHDGHATPAIATYDPRLRGYIVVATHDTRFKVGQLIPDPEEDSP